MHVCLPQSGALPGARQVSGYQYCRGPGDGQSAEQRRGDEGHLHQTHTGGQSCGTERDPEDWRQDRRGKGTIQVVEQADVKLLLRVVTSDSVILLRCSNVRELKRV